MLAPIAERQRRPEHALWQEFELARPHILGALLDAAAHGLHMLPRVRLKRLPRRADFALWATACESAERGALKRELAPTEQSLHECRDALRELRAAVLARQKAEDALAELYRERSIQRAQAAGRDPALPLQ
jgi:hypothetical protein